MASRFKNDIAVSGLIPGIMVFIIIAVGAASFIMLTNEFNIHYDSVIGDPVNNTGILAGNNSSAYMAVKTTSDTINSNLPAGILIGFLFAALVVILLVWAILKKGGD